MNHLLNRLFSNTDATFIFARSVLIIYLAWTGVLAFGEGSAAIFTGWFTDHPLLSSLASDGAVISMVTGLIKLGLASLFGFARPEHALFRLACITTAVLFTLPLTLLVTNPVWVESYGGFPIIGSGQGIIKYVSMVAVPLFLLAMVKPSATTHKAAVAVAITGVVLVMGWIGWMKFYEFEAVGITRLMKSNILFSWLYTIFDVQGASNFIGIVEWGFLILLLLTPWNRLLGLLGLLGIFATAFGTTTFIINTPGYDGFLLNLNSTGQFIIKDWLLLAAAAIFYQYHYQPAGITQALNTGHN